MLILSTAQFGSAYAAIATVGYTLYDSAGSMYAARSTTGVVHLSKGSYSALIQVPVNWIGTVYWDIEGGSDVCAIESIVPDEALYHADIEFTKDEANEQDEWTVTWFKNGARVSSGITTPTIQVVSRASGTNLIATTAMTEIGSTHSYRYDEDTNRVTPGQAVLALARATIDGATREFSRLISRDSIA